MQRNTQGRRALDRIAAEMKSILGGGGERKYLNSSEREKWDRLNREYEKQEALILASEGIRSLDEPRGGPGISDWNLPEISAHELRQMRPHARREALKSQEDRAFSAFLRNGINGLSDEHREVMRGQFRDARALGIQNAQSTTTGSQGGYVVPQGFSDQLMEAMKWYGGIEGVTGEFITETGNPWPWPTVNDTANMGRIIGQNVQVVETDLAFGQVTFNSFILSSDLCLVPLALMEDSYFDFDALLARLLGIRLGRLLNNKCTVGSGSGEPTGIVTAAIAAGLIYNFPTGNTAAISYGDLVNIEHSVDPAYRGANARWMFSDGMLKLLKKLVDGNNRPLWQPGLVASFGDGAAVVGGGRPTILGYPYAINQDMAAPAANADTILFGDMSSYKLRRVGSPTILRLVERYADYLQVGFISFFRADANLIDAGTHPIVVAQQSAS